MVTTTTTLLIYIFTINIADSVLRFAIDRKERQDEILSYGLKVFGIGSQIKVGQKADLTIYDLEENYNIDSSKFVSMGKATPFDGNNVYGKCKMTMVSGNIVFNELGGNNV